MLTMKPPARTSRPLRQALLRTPLLAAVLLPSVADARSSATTPAQSTAPARVSTAPNVTQTAASLAPAPHHVTPMSSHARDHYQVIWGIDSLDVKSVESGQMIRFSYFVVDAAKATQLNDKKASPFLVDEQARVKLEIPTMEKVGQLRQSSPPEAGKSYWMVFSNKGSVVKPGDRVSIVIGRFKADGLFVR